MTFSERPLTVAVDARFADSSGIGVYIRNVMSRLYESRPNWRFRLLGVPDSVRSVLERPGQAECEALDAPYYSISEQFDLRSRIGRDADLVWSPHYNAAVLASPPLLVTVHDVNHLALPGFVKGIHRRAYARVMFEAVRRRADSLLFVSEFSRAEFERLVGPIRAPSFVSYNAVGGVWVDGRATVQLHKRDYLVCVGNVKPHKNMTGMLKAFGLMEDRFDVDLVIVGRREGFLQGDPGTFALAERFGDRVLFTGAVSDDMLKAWVAGARALVMPSFYEGFGLPPLEAMAVNCPTVVSRAASLPEVCGEAAEYVDPHDPADIARGIAQAIGNPARADALRQAGRDRVACFSWRRTGDVVAQAMEAAVARRGLTRRHPGEP